MICNVAAKILFGSTDIRLYVCEKLLQMAIEKRKPRSYKIADKAYLKALKKQTNPPLATFIEGIVTAIANGGQVMVLHTKKSNDTASEENLNTKPKK